MANYNPYENMLHVLDKAAEVLGYKKNDYEFVRYPERELTVSIPITMDDGHVEVFSGYRVQHNTARGAAKGGIRFHPASDENEVKAGIDAGYICGRNSECGQSLQEDRRKASY